MNTHHHPNRALSQEEMEARRLRAVPYFKQEWSERRIAGKLGVSGPSVHDWKVAYLSGGIETLRAGRYGPKPKFGKDAESVVRRNILTGAEAHGFSGNFWTLKRLTLAMKRWTGIAYEDRSIWHVLRRLGFSCQKPIRRAKERDEEAIRTWLAETWPQVKKGASGTA
ncbi:MAG: winged helix-turn-helix domain-containing protein [Candidatus Liptonbacteria bacterium]|nr:winged helix-turn-helix domain-containing protein [Candidatus Liptonbacteria bacterium]